MAEVDARRRRALRARGAHEVLAEHVGDARARVARDAGGADGRENAHRKDRVSDQIESEAQPCSSSPGACMPNAGSRSARRQPPLGRAVREHGHERQREPKARRRVDDGRHDGQRPIHRASAADGLHDPDRNADEERQRERCGAETDRDGERIARARASPARRSEKLSPRSPWSTPPAQRAYCTAIGPVESELGADSRRVGRRRRRRNEESRGITRSETDEREREREHQPEKQQRAGESAQHGERMHALNLHGGFGCQQSRRRSRPRPGAVRRRLLGPGATGGRRRLRVGHRSRVGESARHDPPAVAPDPAIRAVRHARAVRRRARSPFRTRPRSWTWSADRRALTLHLVHGLRWHDGFRPPRATSRSRSTRRAIRRRATGGRPTSRASTQCSFATTRRPKFDSRSAQPAFPLVFCELPIVPAHLLDTIPRADLRSARVQPCARRQRSIRVRGPPRRGALGRFGATMRFPRHSAVRRAWRGSS